VEQTQKQALFRHAFFVTEAGVAGLVLLAGLMPGIVAWRGRREWRAAEKRARVLATHHPMAVQQEEDESEDDDDDDDDA